jgi:YD repeat-containing protein
MKIEVRLTQIVWHYFYEIGIFAFFVFMNLVHPALANEPSKEPILRIETEMHTAAIGRVGIDAENRYLVTGSLDRTVRVWELATGRLLKILRPPIGEGHEGKIYSVAISPDGKTIICGGWTGFEWDRSTSIYVFDRESGTIIHRIKGIPNTIKSLTYSKDGRFFVANVGHNVGVPVSILVYRASDFSLIATDRAYGDQGWSADFDLEGRIVTPSYDGFIRLYNKDFKLIVKKKTSGGNEAASAKFSPDGSKIAVGFHDSPKVEILSGKTLEPLYEPDMTGVENGYLDTVSWSPDGRFLYAGGTHARNGTTLIRKWEEAGKGRYKDLPAAHDEISHILSLKDGGIVFGAVDPALGIFDVNDKKILYNGPPLAEFRINNQDKLLLSPDGTIVQFAYDPSGQVQAQFSISNRLLELAPMGNVNLSPPVFSIDGLEITDWKYNRAPKLNGKSLKIERWETSLSLAISPNGSHFLLGTDLRLLLFDRKGNEQWNIPAPAVVWGVNIAGNGRLALVALGDGTIRWYRMNDGKELLVLFPSNDKKRWVTWTTSGYYDASPGAEGLIGWHKNSGKDEAADFFPISTFRAAYYRPDVVARILETLDENESIRLANEVSSRRTQEVSIKKMLPPVVTILFPKDGTEFSTSEIRIKFTIRTPSGEAVTGIRALVDGRPVGTERGIGLAEKREAVEKSVRETKINIAERDSEISILAENRYSVSDPATVRIKWRQRQEAKKDEFIIKPKLYLLAVGVSKYEKKDLTLGLAAKDATDFADAMLKQKGELYREVVVKSLTDDKATRGEILDGLDWITKETTSKDVAMVFLAGHGVNDSSGVYYYLPVDADTEKLKRTGVPFTEIKNTVASLAGKTLFFVDTCHSGSVMGTRRGVVDITAVVNELTSAENGAVVFASSSGNQYALEDPVWGNGAFTKALVEGVNGKADYAGNGKITINMLDLYLSERVKELTKGRQTPTTTKPQTISDFPIAVKK